MSDHWDTRTDLTRHEREQMRQLERGETPSEADALYQALVDNKGRCSSCKMPVYWTITRNGKKMPVDRAPAPQPGPSQFDLKVNDEGVLRAVFIDTFEQGLRRQRNQPGGYTSHFSTCPNAAKHRRKASTR